ADLHAQLQTASAAGSGDVTVVGVGDVGSRVAELRRVGDAERLTADLHLDLLGEAEDLEDGKVGVEEARSGESIEAGTSEAHAGGLGKAGLGEPGAATLARGIDAVEDGDRGDLVGGLGGARGIERAAAGGEGHGRARHERDDAVDLPAADGFGGQTVVEPLLADTEGEIVDVALDKRLMAIEIGAGVAAAGIAV